MDERVQTTLRLPQPLYDQALKLVDSGEARTFNDLVLASLQSTIQAAERKRIDAQFRDMAADESYQETARSIAAEFEASDWEALAGTEKE